MKLPFTKQYDKIVKDIVTEAAVFPDFKEGELPPLRYFTENAAWDTGSERTVISQEIASALGLKSLGKVDLHGVGDQKGDIYKISIAIPSSKVFHGFYVYGMNIDDYEVLIGMDIISKCDFAITNQDSKTTFSFQTPSSTTIDFKK